MVEPRNKYIATTRLLKSKRIIWSSPTLFLSKEEISKPNLLGSNYYTTYQLPVIN